MNLFKFLEMVDACRFLTCEWMALFVTLDAVEQCLVTGVVL